MNAEQYEKLQDPSSKIQGSSKCQAPIWRTRVLLVLGVWWFLGAWSLVLGASPSPDVAKTPAPPLDWLSALFVFMLATFVGLDVIRRVSRLLHTPLMSLTNAISAIAVVGAIMVAG